MPKVFISWSGTTSFQVATALNKWLPVMLNSIDPFISSDDLRKGGRWASDLASVLEETSFGILCVTPDNLKAPWLMFEAGALSKLVASSFVAPFLHGVKPSDLQGPLAQFNATINEKEDFRKLLKAMNTGSNSGTLRDDLLNRAFDGLWPNLQSDLDAIPKEASPEAPATIPQSPGKEWDPILQELLTLARQQTQMLSSARTPLPSEELSTTTHKDRTDIPARAWQDLFDTFHDAQVAAVSMPRGREKLGLLASLEDLFRPISFLLRRSTPSPTLIVRLEEMRSYMKETRQREAGIIRQIEPRADGDPLESDFG